LQQRLLKYFGCDFEDLFDVVLIDPDSGHERLFGRRMANPMQTVDRR